MLSIYNFKDYKKFIKSYVDSVSPQRGLMRKLAEAANCHPSYLTQALNSKVQLTPDHALGIAEYIDLSAPERDYFLLMVDHSRSSRPTLRTMYEQKMNELKAKQEKIGERLQRVQPSNIEALSKYYSTWHMSAIHILSSVPEFQKLDVLMEKLNLKRAQCEKYLQQLEEMGLVIHRQGLWQHSGTQLHVPDDSHFVNLHHNNWRQQAVLDSQQPQNGSIHFTGVYSISKTDYEVLKGVVLKSIESINKISTASGMEEGVVFCCDLFQPEK